MKRLTSIAVFGGLLLPPAAVTTVPTYTCQELGEDGHGTVVGVQDCRASHGALANGSFTGTVVIRSRPYGFSFTCTGGGRAKLPDTVTASRCFSW